MGARLNSRSAIGGTAEAVQDPSDQCGADGARDLGDTIEVADGLSSGESVVLNISTEITDGQKVSPVVADAPNPSALDSAHAVSEGGE